MKKLFTTLVLASVLSTGFSQTTHHFGFTGLFDSKVRHNNIGFGVSYTVGKTVMVDIGIEQVGFRSVNNDYTSQRNNLPSPWHRYTRTDKITSNLSLCLGVKLGYVIPIVGFTTKATKEFPVYTSPYAMGTYSFASSKMAKVSDTFRFGVILFDKKHQSPYIRFTYDTDKVFSLGVGLTLQK
jgi:hypothetical protein